MAPFKDDHDDDDDIEMKPLVGTSAAPLSPASPRSPAPASSSRRKWVLLVLLSGIATLALVFRKPPNVTSGNTTAAVLSREDSQFQPKLTHKSVQELQRRLTQAIDAFEQHLRIQYGSYYDDIFLEESDERIPRGRNLFTSGKASSTLSRSRLQRRLALKVLEATRKETTFVWATGGHSAAAGHGNFFNESFTAYLEEAMQPILASLSSNLQFIGRNYAMGGTAAAPEVAWCAKEIFGTDLDVLVWDFGMTDGSRSPWKQALYQMRGGLVRTEHPPIQLVFHAGASRSEGERYKIVQFMENAGLGALISSEKVMDAAQDAIPDSFGLSDAGIQALPEFVQNFRCGTQVENGDPYCKEKKYHLEQCPERKYQTNWHPGWKWHSLMGYLCAFYLTEVLKETLSDLAERLLTTSAVEIYREFRSTEQFEYQKFTQAKVFDSIEEVLPPDGRDGFNADILVKGANFCHTAKLPAEIRYRGLLTETPDYQGMFSYNPGLGLKDIPAYIHAHKSDAHQVMPLVYTEDERQKCPRPTNMDYKDYFYIAANVGWQSLTVPNPSARQYYGPEVRLHGYVALCITLCTWGKCPSSALDRSAFEQQQWRLKVNGVPVTEFFSILECELLRHADGYQFPVDDENNSVTLEAEIVTNGTETQRPYMRISSVMAW